MFQCLRWIIIVIINNNNTNNNNNNNINNINNNNTSLSLTFKAITSIVANSPLPHLNCPLPPSLLLLSPFLLPLLPLRLDGPKLVCFLPLVPVGPFSLRIRVSISFLEFGNFSLSAEQMEPTLPVDEWNSCLASA